jgi:hypothetical protein
MINSDETLIDGLCVPFAVAVSAVRVLMQEIIIARSYTQFNRKVIANLVNHNIIRSEIRVTDRPLNAVGLELNSSHCGLYFILY